MLRVSLLSFLLALLFIAPIGIVRPVEAVSVLSPATTGGTAAVDRALFRLTVHRRMLMIGAHPDDEDNTLLTYVAQELGGEAAYLSLSRGEGGQNLIGDELGEALGVLRTGELLAARRLEGGRQFFTRAYDFGYSKSLDETLKAWPREAMAEDVRRIVRRFKPQVVVSIFPGDGRGRHGQHTAAGVMANSLFEADETETVATLLDREGWPTWMPESLYRRPWWNPEESDFEISLGGLDPSTGRSVFQRAAESRSLHRSQDMGRRQPLGDRTAGLERVRGPEPSLENGEAGETGLFEGIDTSLEAIADLLAAGDERQRLRAELAAIRKLSEEARSELSFSDPTGAVAPLAEISRRLATACDALMERTDPEARRVLALLEEKRDVAFGGLLAAAGVAVDASADREELVSGETAEIEVEVWSASPTPVKVMEIELLGETGLTTDWAEGDGGGADALEVDSPADGIDRRRGTLRIASAAQPTIPYFLANEREGSLYDWSEVDAEQRGLPEASPPLVARVELEVAGALVEIEREVVYRSADQALGEVRRPLRIVPAVEVTLTPELTVVPVSSGAIPIRVGLQSNAAQAVSGEVEIELPAEWIADGWAVVGDRDFEIVDPGGQTGLDLTVRLDGGRSTIPRSGRFELAATAVTHEGRFGASYPVVDFPHIRPTAVPKFARAMVTRVDLELPELGRVGYVRGAADRTPESLARVGLKVEVLDSATLASGDLSDFDAIVVGGRAYEIDPGLRESHPRLLRYLEGGGLLLVQYQQYQFVEGGYSPLPISISRPHGRVTDETAPVRPIDPSHRVFRSPNELVESDWEGWVQERGLYFAGEWDPALEPLLALADPGEEELLGALLVGRVGAGTYVYTGISFFRQLPVGIPGAYRLFANLLALAESEEVASGRSSDPERGRANVPALPPARLQSQNKENTQ